jgi:hypothetical protein
MERSDDRPKENKEADYEFYNRSSWPQMQLVRDLLDDFVSRYPDSEQSELIARIKSGNDDHFKSATFELFLHEALLRLGCNLIPHPELENGSKARPDFLVTTPDGEEFYLEAVLASERNEENPAAEAIKASVFDYLNRHPHNSFMLEIDDDGDPLSQPSARSLLNRINAWLETLDPDLLREQMDSQGLESIDVFEWHHEDWNVQIRPIPMSRELRGRLDSFIGIGGYGGGFVNAWTPIRDAVKSKGSKYGLLDKPYIVAINFNSFFLDPIDEAQALFGQEQFTVNPNNRAETRITRARNGAWFGGGGPQYKRVSGVCLFNDLHPTGIANRRHTIYLNPWANYPVPEFLRQFPHAILNNTRLEKNEGLSLTDIFGLNANWPMDG